MAIWTNGGTLVIDGSGKVITCATCPCGGSFCDSIPASITVDIGAGGWVDEDCNYCDQVLGQYTLTMTSSYSAEAYCEAYYQYDECPVCEELCTDRHAGFRIQAYIKYTIATAKYEVQVFVSIEANDNETALCFAKDDATPSSWAQAYYNEAAIDGPPPLTIDQTSNAHQAWIAGASCPGLQVCTGTLAATVEVDW